MLTTRSTENRCEPPHTSHPLEVFPLFRRIPRSLARDLLYTLIWNSGLAVLLSTVKLMLSAQDAEPGTVFWKVWVVSNCIGYLVHGGFLACSQFWGHPTGERSAAYKLLYYGAIPLVAVFAGYWLGLTLLKVDTQRYLFTPQTLTSTAVISVLISALLARIYIGRARQAEAEAERQRELARIELLEKQALVSNLRMLQAQIEPHFLFNTLANVVSLIDAAPTQAKQMLEDFIAYLRASLSATRAEQLTLRQEMELIRAYLRLLELRMDARLRWRIDIPDALLDMPFPPMLLQPLVENAIRHGLEPNISGGRIDITATQNAGTLRIYISDTGLGLGATVREGVGLSNVRERLTSLFGAAGRLTLADNVPNGTQAIIETPSP